MDHELKLEGKRKTKQDKKKKRNVYRKGRKWKLIWNIKAYRKWHLESWNQLMMLSRKEERKRNTKGN